MLLAQLRRTLGQASKSLTEYDSSGPTRRHLETPQALERRTQEGKLGDPSDVPVVAYSRAGLPGSEWDGQLPTPRHVAENLHALLEHVHDWFLAMLRNRE